MSTLVGLLASNVGLIAADAPAYATVNRFLLPLAVPLLLFAADMRRVLASTGRLLSIFCVGSGMLSIQRDGFTFDIVLLLCVCCVV